MGGSGVHQLEILESRVHWVLILWMNNSPVTPDSDLLANSAMKGSEGASEENVVRVLCILMWYVGLHLYFVI